MSFCLQNEYVGFVFYRKGSLGVWVEQCWRDVLQITWGLTNNTNEFHKRMPPSQPVTVTTSCCQQFIMSRRMVLNRPLSVWKQLLKIINEQDVCHIGEPDKTHLSIVRRDKNLARTGPEKVVYILPGGIKESNGRTIQGGAMEHLAHVVFGDKPLHMPSPTMDSICEHFEKDCLFSPC
jgi:hypothetical protein